MTKKLRIVLINSFADLGGAQIATLRLARGLQDRGHETTLLFLYERTPIASAEHPYEILLEGKPRGPASYFKIATRLARRLHHEKPDVVLSFLPLANIMGQAAALLSGVRARIVSHRVPVSTTHALLQRLDGIWARLGIYTDVVAVSEGVRSTCQHYPEWLRSRTVVVHNGIKDWRPSQLSRVAARRRFGVLDGRLVLVAIGRLVPQKNYPFLLGVMERAPNATLLIAGEGPLRTELEAIGARMEDPSRIRILGHLDRSDVPDLLAAADIFVQPSTFEGQSNAILEALHARVPIVANDIPEQRETIAEDDGTTAGALVPTGDFDAWVQAIEAFRDDVGLVQAACVVSARRADLFRYETMVTGFEAVMWNGAGSASP